MRYHLSRPLVFLLSVLIVSSASAQPDPAACEKLKTGIFYSYPVNVNDNFKSERSADRQLEINTVTGDTIYFQIKWNKCQYSLKYISGGNKLSREVLKLFKEHTIVSVITDVTAYYYVATNYIDDATTTYPISVDTLWNSEQMVPSDCVVLRALTPAEQRKAKLKDTSSFALLYLYRPSRFVCSGIHFPLYNDDILMCGFPEHGGGYVFKIYKQGPLRLQGQHRQKKDYLDLNIHFGQKYYVRVDTKWSMARCIPFLIEKDKEKGEEEFLEVPQY